MHKICFTPKKELPLLKNTDMETLTVREFRSNLAEVTKVCDNTEASQEKTDENLEIL